MKTKAARSSRSDAFDIEGLAKCTGCKCTDLNGCTGGCTWIKLDRENGTGLCSKCFKGKLPRTKHKPDNRCIYISDRAAGNIRAATAVGELFSWGLQRLVDMTGKKPPPPPKTLQEALRRGKQARHSLAKIQKRIAKENQADPDGGPDRPGSN